MFLTGALAQHAKIKITRHEKNSELHRWAFLKTGADYKGNVSEDLVGDSVSQSFKMKLKAIQK